MISFGLMVSGKSNEIFYPGEKCSAAQPGQVFYVCLNIIGNFLKIAVTHKIIGVDHENKIMTLSYVEGGETVGKQDIQLSQTNDGNTKITHTTYYKGQPGFREKYLYPYFHTKAIKEFHANLRNSYKAEKANQ
jgi:glucosamine 6-phosphate synthetase-like amidotransferase/phosphosugar isomerase protein